MLLCGDLQSPMLVMWYSITVAGKDFFLPHSAAQFDLLKTAFICKTVFFFPPSFLNMSIVMHIFLV